MQVRSQRTKSHVTHLIRTWLLIHVFTIMDLDIVKPDLITREFLAVVLAGFGNEYVHISFVSSLPSLILSSRLVPLTSDYGDEPCPKSLLPVGNKPLLEYILTWLEQSGIKGIYSLSPAFSH